MNEEQLKKEVARLNEEIEKMKRESSIKIEYRSLYEELRFCQTLKRACDDAEMYAQTIIDEFGDECGWLSEVWDKYRQMVGAKQSMIENELDKLDAEASA